jgi:hypothetical protein
MFKTLQFTSDLMVDDNGSEISSVKTVKQLRSMWFVLTPKTMRMNATDASLESVINVLIF